MSFQQQVYGYLVQLQLPFDNERIAAAKFRIKVLRTEAEMLKDLAVRYDENRRAYENSVPEILSLLENDDEGHWEFCDNDEQFAEVFLEWSAEERIDEIFKCISLEESANDMHWKELADGTTIIFAGGETSGDDPSGFGFGCLKDLTRFGLLDALGIT